MITYVMKHVLYKKKKIMYTTEHFKRFAYRFDGCWNQILTIVRPNTMDTGRIYVFTVDFCTLVDPLRVVKFSGFVLSIIHVV